MPLQGKYDVKLGRSFMDSSPTSFMTMRCDFLPASVDRSKTGTINISNEKEVGVRLPNINGAEPSSTLFKGNMRPVNKECLLIYNKTTGELTLERISKAAQLKKYRDELAPKKPDLEQPPPSDLGSAVPNSKVKHARKMSESSSDDELATKSNVKDTTSLSNKTLKSIISPTHRRSLKTAVAPTRTSTLSSSSSSDSENTPESNFSCNPPLFSSPSSPSSLSDLDAPETHSLSKNSKPNSVSPDKSTKPPITNSPFLIHRDLMENDLHLSESDSDE